MRATLGRVGAEGRGEFVDASFYPFVLGCELAERTTELIARRRILSLAEQPAQLFFGDLVTRRRGLCQSIQARSVPAAGRCARLLVVSRQRVVSITMSVTGCDRFEQLTIALSCRHDSNRYCHSSQVRDLRPSRPRAGASIGYLACARGDCLLSLRCEEPGPCVTPKPLQFILDAGAVDGRFV